MGNRLYVGNLAYALRDNDLQEAFSAFGNVTHAKVMMDHGSGRSKGFGFVEMSTDAEAQAAIQGLHGKPLGGRDLTVNEARPRDASPRSSFGGGGGGGFRSPYGSRSGGASGGGSGGAAA